MTEINAIPYELILYILKQSDVNTISVMCCVNRYFKEIITRNKWEIIDYILIRKPDEMFKIPLNSETYKSYRYISNFLVRNWNEENRSQLSTSLLNTLVEENNINIQYLITNFKFEDDFLSCNWNKLDILLLLRYQKFPLCVMFDIVDKRNSNVSENLFWELFCRHQSLPLYFIDRYQNYINWVALSENKSSLTTNVMNKYKGKLIWQEVSKHGLVEELVYKFLTYFDIFSWINVSCYSKLSDEFIRKYVDKLHIPSMLVYQTLKPDTIEMLIEKDCVNPKIGLWEKVSEYQSLSYDFIMKNKEHLKLDFMISNTNISRRELSDVFG